jgi:hypothetical protein
VFRISPEAIPFIPSQIMGRAHSTLIPGYPSGSSKRYYSIISHVFQSEFRTTSPYLSYVSRFCIFVQPSDAWILSAHVFVVMNYIICVKCLICIRKLHLLCCKLTVQSHSHTVNISQPFTGESSPVQYKIKQSASSMEIKLMSTITCFTSSLL